MDGLQEAIDLYNYDAEQSVLGAILLEPDLIKDCPNIPEHFSPGRHHNLFWTMKNMDEKGMPIDPIAIVERVGKKIGELGGVTYITELAGSVPTTANFKYYCQVVIDYYQKRQAITIANQIKRDAMEGSAIEAIQSGTNRLMSIEDAGTDDDDGDIKESLIEMYEDVENATGEVTGIKTGYTELDRMTGGYKGGDLIIVGARPGIGKTAYAINKGLNASANPTNPGGDVVALFSLEMGKKQLLKRAATTIGNIDAQRMKTAGVDFSSDDWSKLTNAMGFLSNSDFKIFDRPGQDVNYIWSKCRKLKRQFPDRRIMIIIDYLQLIVGDRIHQGNRTAEIGDISRALKRMARELDVVVVALSQLSRNVEKRQDKRPMLSDLRESGQLEQDADIIQFLYRDDYYDTETESQNIIEVIMAKHRDGPTGTVELAFIKEYGKFANINYNY